VTKLHLLSGDVYTELSPAEVRQYLSGGAKGGAINGFQDSLGTVKIIIAVHAIEFIYE
jgi:hypothetical protein